MILLVKKCPNCGQNIPEEASFCLHCFSPQNVTPIKLIEEKKKKPKAVIFSALIALLIITLVTVIICVGGLKNDDNDKGQSTERTTASSTVTTKRQTTTKKVSTTENTTVTEITTAKPTSDTTSTEHTSTATSTEDISTKKATTKLTTTKKATTSEKTSSPSVIINGNTLMNYPAERKNTTYTIPYDVTKIANNAFNGNKYIKTLKFSKREMIECDWNNLFSNLPNLEAVYVYPGTSADLEGLQYFDGEIVYYD